MSYDLFLRSKTTSGDDIKEIKKHILSSSDLFRGDDDGDEFSYYNKDTDVSFRVEFKKNDDYPIYININYFRPHFFINELYLELKSLMKEFSFMVNDPQLGITDKPLDLDLLDEIKKTWITSNKSFSTAMVNRNREKGRTSLHGDYQLPYAKLDAIWWWNYYRNNLRVELKEDTGKLVFVANVFVGRREGKLFTFATWTDAILTALPSFIDYILAIDLDPNHKIKKRRLIKISDHQNLLSKYVSKSKRKDTFYTIRGEDGGNDLLKLHKMGQTVAKNNDLKLIRLGDITDE